jgi:hypothetical protein
MRRTKRLPYAKFHFARGRATARRVSSTVETLAPRAPSPTVLTVGSWPNAFPAAAGARCASRANLLANLGVQKDSRQGSKNCSRICIVTSLGSANQIVLTRNFHKICWTRWVRIGLSCKCC